MSIAQKAQRYLGEAHEDDLGTVVHDVPSGEILSALRQHIRNQGLRHRLERPSSGDRYAANVHIDQDPLRAQRHLRKLAWLRSKITSFKRGS